MCFTKMHLLLTLIEYFKKFTSVLLVDIKTKHSQYFSEDFSINIFLIKHSNARLLREKVRLSKIRRKSFF